jgi:glycosyltransferase involved in cell wall biosynthesis
VILSAGNIAHYHHAAYALQQAGYLHRYLCAFSGQADLGILHHFLPQDLKKRLQGKALPELNVSNIKTFPWPYLITQALHRAKLLHQTQVNEWLSGLYDRSTLRWVKDCDVFHFVCTMGLQGARKVKQSGGLTVCDVRIAHVRFEEEILRNESSRWGIDYKPRSKDYIDKITAEYAVADRIIVPSIFVAETFSQQGIGLEKLDVVPYGVDISRFTTRTDRCHNWEKEKNENFRILCVGSVSLRKGVHYLLSAFDNLKLPASELIMLGEVNRQFVAKLESRARNQKVRFLGTVPQLELRKFYENASMLVLPSLCEGSAMVIYEAMAAGLPVITTPNAGSIVRDGEDGFIVPASDVLALEERIHWMYEHPEERIEMGQSAAERVKEFTWERYGERLLQLYGKILGEIPAERTMA